jgi:hypothetical protein
MVKTGGHYVGACLPQAFSMEQPHQALLPASDEAAGQLGGMASEVGVWTWQGHSRQGSVQGGL